MFPEHSARLMRPLCVEQDTLLYVTLHAFRHLLRNDLRLSHLYEIAFFLQRTSDQDRFWEDLIPSVTQCSNATKMVATTFELARSLFHPALSLSARHFIERYLPATAASWVRAYGRTGAIHCYRKNRNALLLHLGLLNDNAQRWALVRQRLLPRHLPLPTYGVQTPPEAQDLKFRVVKACSLPAVALTAWPVSRSIAGRTAFTTPTLAHSASAATKRSRGTRPALLEMWESASGRRSDVVTATIAARSRLPRPSNFKTETWQKP